MLISFVVIVLVIFLALAFFQLKFFKEGDKKFAKKLPALMPQVKVKKAPQGLKNIRYKRIWENIDLTSALLKEKDVKSQKIKFNKEAIKLGLSDEEKIIFITGGQSRNLFYLSWVLITVSVLSNLYGDTVATMSPYSFPALIAGFFLLLTSLILGSVKRYYFTNYRILVKTSLFNFGKCKWTQVYYDKIKKVQKKSFSRFLINTESERQIKLGSFSKNRAKVVKEIILKNEKNI